MKQTNAHGVTVRTWGDHGRCFVSASANGRTTGAIAVRPEQVAVFTENATPDTVQMYADDRRTARGER